jgi:hypothetical protein
MCVCDLTTLAFARLCGDADTWGIPLCGGVGAQNAPVNSSGPQQAPHFVFVDVVASLAPPAGSPSSSAPPVTPPQAAARALLYHPTGGQAMLTAISLAVVAARVAGLRPTPNPTEAAAPAPAPTAPPPPPPATATAAAEGEREEEEAGLDAPVGEDASTPAAASAASTAAPAAVADGRQRVLQAGVHVFDQWAQAWCEDLWDDAKRLGAILDCHTIDLQHAQRD